MTSTPFHRVIQRKPILKVALAHEVSVAHVPASCRVHEVPNGMKMQLKKRLFTEIWHLFKSSGWMIERLSWFLRRQLSLPAWLFFSSGHIATLRKFEYGLVPRTTPRKFPNLEKCVLKMEKWI